MGFFAKNYNLWQSHVRNGAVRPSVLHFSARPFFVNSHFQKSTGSWACELTFNLLQLVISPGSGKRRATKNTFCLPLQPMQGRTDPDAWSTHNKLYPWIDVTGQSLDGIRQCLVRGRQQPRKNWRGDRAEQRNEMRACRSWPTSFSMERFSHAHCTCFERLSHKFHLTRFSFFLLFHGCLHRRTTAFQ